MLVGLAKLIRLPNIFTTVSNIVAAHVVVTGGNIQWQSLMLTLLASISFYHGGMILNDCFDFEEDKQVRSSRPLPSGLISLSTAWCLGVTLLLLGLLLAYWVGVVTFVVASGLAISIVAYNLSSREGLIGCMLMGSCRLLNWVMGLSVVTGFMVYWPYAVLVGIYVAALTMISRDETDASHPAWVLFSAVAMVFGVLGFLSVMWQYDMINVVGAIVLLTGLMIILQRLVDLKHQYTPQKIQAMVMFLVIGLIPLDALLVMISGHVVAGIFIMMLIVPCRLLARRLYVT